MRGVSGLELEILQRKAAGDSFSKSCCNDPIWIAVNELIERGLLIPKTAIPCKCGSGIVLLGQNTITQMGRIVLAASESI